MWAWGVKVVLTVVLVELQADDSSALRHVSTRHSLKLNSSELLYERKKDGELTWAATSRRNLSVATVAGWKSLKANGRAANGKQTNGRCRNTKRCFVFDVGGVTVMDFRFAATSVSCLTKLYAGKEVRPAYSLHLYVVFFKKNINWTCSMNARRRAFIIFSFNPARTLVLNDIHMPQDYIF